jgi:vesicle-fusing ATPase
LNSADFEQVVGDAITGSKSDPVANVLIESMSGTWVFLAAPHSAMNIGEVGMNGVQRKSGPFTLKQELQVSVFTPGASEALVSMTLGVDLLVKKSDNKTASKFDAKELEESFKANFGFQVLHKQQKLAFDFNGTKLDILVDSFEGVTLIDGASDQTSFRGQLLPTTNLNFKKAAGTMSHIIIEGGSGPQKNESLFKSDFDFAKMGVGGLGTEFQTIFRRAFAPRIFPGLVKELGVNFVRGMLLYGPPGCGKTLIARQIGKVLNAREPKIINGPEVLDKFVGGSEEKIRALFADAEAEQAEMGDSSMLHIIIFDEMDAVMKQRGSGRDSSGVSDSIVNQLLSKIDGVDSLNNILIIGMTNRKDMIDDAILRPGRLEMHVEIGLPDEHGRTQIIDIHTSTMRSKSRITPAALERLPELARLTKNYTGAELEGLIRSAASFALSKGIDPANMSCVDPTAIAVDWPDFERAVNETTPAFGAKDNEEMQTYFRNGLIDYGSGFSDLWSNLGRFLNQIKTSDRTPILSVLLEGPVFTGKTAIAAKLCAESDINFIRMISPDSMIGMNDAQKCSKITRVFQDSYKSQLSVIFLDDLERLLDYTPIGPRFSNLILQTLLVLVRKPPPEQGRRLMIIATTSVAHLLEELQLTKAFNVTLHVSQLQTQQDIHAVLSAKENGLSSVEAANITEAIGALDSPIGIKQLLMVLEMARSVGEESISANTFMECLSTCGF